MDYAVRVGLGSGQFAYFEVSADDLFRAKCEALAIACDTYGIEGFRYVKVVRLEPWTQPQERTGESDADYFDRRALALADKMGGRELNRKSDVAWKLAWLLERASGAVRVPDAMPEVLK